MDRTLKPGDLITVDIPAGPGAVGAALGIVRTGIVKSVSSSGRIHWYCTGAERCGYCGPGIDEGNHRVGMAGSRLI